MLDYILKLNTFKPNTVLGDSSLHLVESLLKIYSPGEASDPSEILKLNRECFPTCDKIFTQELIQNPLLLISLHNGFLQCFSFNTSVHETNWNDRT